MTPWEMGSEFHLMTPPAQSALEFEAFSGELFVNGRAALRAIIEGHELKANRVWLPSYVCSDVFDVLTPLVKLQIYCDYPDEPAPRFDTLLAQPGDVVVIQDTFGLSDVHHWRAWLENQSEIVTVEDISHNSTQERYLQSPADYVFSSLRKSLPVADGGIVFSREGSLRQSGMIANPGSGQKLEAMVIKRLYLDGYAIEKQSFRDLQIQGEHQLNEASTGGCLIHTEQMLNTLPHKSMRATWYSNTLRLRSHLQDALFAEFINPLLPRGPVQGLFHLVIECHSQIIREILRSELLANSVFPAVHWEQDHNQLDQRAADLSHRLLTLPTDFRYGHDDIDRLAEILGRRLRGL